MPISGSYYYPSVSKANSSYPSVDMREVSLPEGSTGLGKLAVDASGNLYYIDGDGDQILVATTASLQQVFTGDVAITGALEFPVDAPADSAHIIAESSDLILSSSGGSQVAVSGGLKVQEDVNVDGAVLISTGFAGGIITDADSDTGIHRAVADKWTFRTGGKDIVFDSDNAISAQGYDLILSSSATSNVAVSSSLKVDGTVDVGGQATFNSAVTVADNQDLRLGTSGDYWFEYMTSVGQLALRKSGGDKVMVITDGTVDATFSGSLKVEGQIHGAQLSSSVPGGTTQTIDWNQGNVQTLDLEEATGDVTLTFSNPQDSACYVLKIIQDSATARDVVWPAAVLWDDSVTPVISTGGNAVDIVAMIYDGTYYHASISQNKG